MSKTVNINDSKSVVPISYDERDYSWASTSNLGNGYANSSSTSYAQINLKTGSSATTYIYYVFDTLTGIPNNATNITVSCTCKCSISNTSSSRVATRRAQLFTGTTSKGSAYTVANSTTAFSITAGSWTRAELQEARLRLYAVRGTSSTNSSYYFRFYGATLTVSYTYQGTAYTITASSTASGVTAEPSTRDVMSGESGTVRISDNTNVIVTDNNIDVTSQLVQKTETAASYTVNSVSGASYGFALSNGYYVSQNKGVDKSAALCRVNFHVPVEATITFTFINYAEQGYDFGVFGNIDTALSTAYYAAGSNGATITDTSYKLACNTSTYNTSSTKTLAYTMSSGDHFIDVKFSKDDGTSSNNDTLQFRVSITLNEAFTPGTYYEYTITNIAADHTILVASSSSGPSFNIKVKNNGSWVSAKKVFVKQNGTWNQASGVKAKSGGSWH